MPPHTDKSCGGGVEGWRENFTSGLSVSPRD